MKEARMEAYFGIYQGNEAKYSELGPATSVVDTLMRDPEAVGDHIVGQYHLPLEGTPPGEMTVWMPNRVKEREIWRQGKRDELEKKIQSKTWVHDNYDKPRQK